VEGSGEGAVVGPDVCIIGDCEGIFVGGSEG
jgi:hypothetical protein